MKTIMLDASGWKAVQDFYDAILPELGAPEWHGNNVNALTESMVWGEINAVEPPFRVEVTSTRDLPSGVAQEVRWTAEGVIDARRDFRERMGADVDVSFVIVS